MRAGSGVDRAAIPRHEHRRAGRAGHGVHHSGGISRRAGGKSGAGLAGMGLQPGIRQCAGTDMPPVQLLLVPAVPARVRPAASGRTLESQARV